MDLGTQGNAFGLGERLAPTLADMDHRPEDPDIANGGHVALAIMARNKPVIAAVNGAAVGIDATMLLAMDIRLASDQARFGFVFGRVGITPETCCVPWSLRPTCAPRPNAWHAASSAGARRCRQHWRGR